MPNVNGVAKKTLGLHFFLVWAALLLCAAADNEPLPPEKKEVKNVILIGWDAAGRDNIKEYMEQGDLPNLKQLASEGTIVTIDIARYTDTKAGWAQILTGYEPEVTGVFNNDIYRPIPKGYSVFERLEAFWGPKNIVTVAVIAKKKHIDTEPPVRKKLSKAKIRALERNRAAIEKTEIITEDPAQLPALEVSGFATYQKQPGKPYFCTKDGLDVFENGLMKDDLVGQRALQLLERYKDERFFFFVHFAEIDHSGHKYGEGSKQQIQAYRSADRWTGLIMEKLKTLGLYDETAIYVTSDHGFIRKTKRHFDAPYIFLATDDKDVIRQGNRVDITPTILDRFGVDLSQIQPTLDGHSLLRPYDPPKW